MNEEAKLHFYSISKCGYYIYGKKDPEFGDIKNLLKQLKKWTTHPDINLKDTCTYKLIDNEIDLMRTFCFDIENNDKTGDFFYNYME